MESNQNMVDTAPEKCVSGNYSKENPCKEWMSKWGWCGNTDAHKNDGTDCTQWWNAAAGADTAAGAGAAAGATPEPTDSNLKRGVCLGINTSGQDDASCAFLDNENDCNIDIKCKWVSGRLPSAPGINPDGPCKPNCSAPKQPTGNCLNTPIQAADGSQKMVKLCPQICPYSSLDRDNTHCKYDRDCAGCPLVEFDWGTKSDNPNRADENKFFYKGQWYTPGVDTDIVSDTNTEYTPTSGGWSSGISDTGNNIIDKKVTQQVLEEKDVIPSDIDLNVDHATNFSRIGNNVINKIAAIRNLDIPAIDDNDKELLGRAYREVYEIKQGNDEVAIKAMETKFQQTVVYVLTQTKLEGKSVSWDTPKQTSSLDSTTGMYDDNSNAFFAQGDMAKNKTEKPEGGLCLWNGCDKSRRRPYDSIWSLY